MKLPAPIGSFDIPKELSLTAAGALGQCRLRTVIPPQVRREGTLPRSPKSVLGDVIHSLLEWATQEPLDGPSAKGKAKAKLQELLDAQRARVRERDPTYRWPLLNQTMPVPEWERMRGHWLRVAAGLLQAPPHGKRRQGPAERGHAVAAENLDGPGVWTEVPINAPSLRLVGRMDRLEWRSDGTLVVLDYKSGSVTDFSGEMKESIVAQMQLYGLALREHFPTFPIRLEIEDGNQRFEVPFGEQEQRDRKDSLAAFMEALPPGSPVEDPAVLASPSPDECRWCNVRHRCSAYLAAAPGWRSQGSRGGRLPPDYWGTVLELETSQRTTRVLLRDASQRSVWINDLDATSSLVASIQPRDKAWFFGLVARDEVTDDGLHLLDRGPHELPGGSSPYRAWSLAIFRTEAEP